jgi:hypothetical protein
MSKTILFVQNMLERSKFKFNSFLTGYGSCERYDAVIDGPFLKGTQ